MFTMSAQKEKSSRSDSQLTREGRNDKMIF